MNLVRGEAGGAPGEPELVIAADGETASVVAAERIAAALIEAVKARGAAHWSTTGGTTPGAIYRYLASAPHRDTVPWDRVHLWWGDDRWVPEDSVLSNALVCWDLLLHDVPVPAGQVHVMPIGEAMAGGHSPAWVATRYAEELRAAALRLDPAGFPILDIVLVGIGLDGHLFSVFPGSATWDDPAWAQAVPAPTHIAPRVERVTLHPRIMDAAGLPIAVAHGAPKAGILGRIFGPRGDERDLPALLARRPGAVWILDQAAAGEIPAELRGASDG
jgi:6-phosphogluconolactonase